MHIMNKNRGTKGYTLTELLTVIAITLVLCAVAVISVSNYYNSLKQLEMDNMAKQLYVAVQNHLTYADSTGQLEQYSEDNEIGNKMNDKPSDMKKGDWESANSDYRYIVYNPGEKKERLENSILQTMLPEGSIDDTVRLNGSYIIEYNRKTATVYSVFYTEKGNKHALTKKDEEDNLNPGFNYRGSSGKDGISKEQALKNRKNYNNKSGKFHLGYYGGSDISIPNGKVKAPELKVDNGDRLTVLVTDVNTNRTSNTGSMLLVTGADSGSSMAFNLSEDKKDKNKNWYLKKTKDGKKIYYVDLDDITVKNGHFAEIFGDDFIPGEDLYLTAGTFGIDTVTSVSLSDPEVTNSLYNSLKKEKNGNYTAYVSSIRHIENLDPSISGINNSDAFNGSVITDVHQCENIDYEAFKDTVTKVKGKKKNGFSIYKLNEKKSVVSNSYYSIKNEKLRLYNGNKQKIENLDIRGQENAGLFSEVAGSGLNISNLTLKDPYVQGVGTAGGFVGKTVPVKGRKLGNNIAIMNSSVEGEKSMIRAVGNNSYAGGLIGDCETACDIQKSFSTALVQSNLTAGGLIGKIHNTNQEAKKGSIIENSYAAGRTYDGGKYNRHYCNVMANGSVGGLIGETGGLMPTWIYNCYSTASAKGNGNVGGFIGSATEIYSMTEIKDSYATGLVRTGNRNNRYIGTFIGRTNPLTVISSGNNYVLFGINGFEYNITGNYGDCGIAEKGCTTDIRNGAEWCNEPHPYDKELIRKKVPFRLRTVTGNTHYGDWPDGKTVITITKDIDNRTCKADNLNINRDWLARQNLYFTLINQTTNQRRQFYYNGGEFKENKNGSYSFTFVLSGDYFSPEDRLTFNETNERVQNVFNEKEFTVKKNENITAEEKNKETIMFQLGINDMIDIEVKNTYLDLAYINFQYRDANDNRIKPLKKQEVGAGYGVLAPTAAKVVPFQGTMFRGIWVLTNASGEPIDLKGNPVKEEDYVRINKDGYFVDRKGKSTGKKYKVPNKPDGVKPGEYNIYFTALYERFPVVTIQYGTIKHGKFTPIIADDKSQIKIGGEFKKHIDTRTVLGDTYKIEKALEKGKPAKGITVGSDRKSLNINLTDIYENHTYQIVVKGDDALYGIKYVYKDTVIDKKTGEYRFAEGKTAVITDKNTYPGIVGTLTNITEKNLKPAPEGFSRPLWTNSKIEKNVKEGIPKTYVEVSYRREAERLNYSLNGGYLNGDSTVKTQIYKYGETVKLEKTPERSGYDFLGWEVIDGDGSLISIPGAKEIEYTDDNCLKHKATVVPEETKFVIKNRSVTVNAIWQQKEKATYTVEFYVQDPTDHFNLEDEDKNYLYDHSISKTGDTGEILYISENKAASYLKTIETVDEPEKTLLYNWKNTKLKGLSKDGKAIKVRADGSTVVKVYYDRNIYTLQFRDVTDDYVYRPVKSGDAGRKQYGLVDGKYRILTMHKKNVKTWKMDNYLIAKGNTPNEQSL